MIGRVKRLWADPAVGPVAIGALAFYWSFGALTELARSIGAPWHRAWVLPFTIDAFIAALARIAYLRIQRGDRQRLGIEALLVLYGALTVAANALHATCGNTLCYIVNGVPGLTLALIVHVWLSERRRLFQGVEPPRVAPPRPAPALEAGAASNKADTGTSKNTGAGHPHPRARRGRAAATARHSDGAKRRALQRIRDGERAVDVAADLGVDRSTLHRWAKSLPEPTGRNGAGPA